MCSDLCLVRLLTKTKKLRPLVKYALPPCCCCCPQPQGQNFVDTLEQRVKEIFQENEIRTTTTATKTPQICIFDYEVFLHALHVHFSSFHILKTFSFFLRREMTCFAVVWTTSAYDDKCSILSSYVPSAGSNLIPG